MDTNILNSSTIFNEKYLIHLHKKTFGSLFSFAGKFRTSNISKGFTTFCQVRFLNQTSSKIFSKLSNENYLRDFIDKPPKEFAKKIAYYLCELTALHPFFEFNGRTIRLFFDMIATYNGYEYIDYQEALKIQNGQNKFIQASIDCMLGNDTKMYNIIIKGLNKAL
jgi:cell filamentation protein, protein adenylyltransferase